MEGGFLRYVWRHSRRDQLFILAVTVAAFPLLYLSLEIPKIIINDAIKGEGFPRRVLGVALEQVPYLMALCALFLATVLAINGLKWVMNIAVGMTGERMLRRMRQQMFDSVMRFPMRRFTSTRPGEIVQAIMAEVEPLSGFIGEIVATPVYQGGTLLVFVGFIFVQDPWLGLAGVAMIPVQAYVIPLLQKKVVRLNRERAANARRLADAIAGAVGGIDDIRVNAAAPWTLAQIAGRLYRNTEIRLALYKRKFLIKFLNNLLNQITPFFFFLIGGAMVINGRLDLGALVAVLAAYKDISKPWREVLNFYQRWSDFSSRFDFVAEAFSGADVMDAARLHRAGPAPMAGALRLEGVETGPAEGGLSVRRLEVAAGRSLAVVGGEQGARLALMRVCAGLQAPARGRVSLGGRDLAAASLPELGAAIGHVAPDPALIDATIRENLVYGLLRRAPDLADRTDPAAAAMLAEARRTGSPTADPEGDWVDYAAAGVADAAALEARLAALVDAAGFGPDLVAAALRVRPEPGQAGRWAAAVAAARPRLAATLAAEGLEDAVEPWRRDRFIENATLLQNILFAAADGAAEDAASQMAAPRAAEVLEAIGAEPLLVEVGADLAREFAQVVATVGRDSAVLDSLGGFDRVAALAAAELAAADADAPDTRRRLARLAAGFAPQRDRFDVLDEARRARALALRAAAAPLTAQGKGFQTFDGEGFIASFTLADAMLGGLRRHDRRSTWKALDAALVRAAAAAGLGEELSALGMDGRAGPGGALLTQGMRRRIALVRALLKRPALVVLSGPVEPALRALVRAEAPQAVLLYAADDAAAAGADVIARLAEDGTLTDIIEQNGDAAAQ